MILLQRRHPAGALVQEGPHHPAAAVLRFDGRPGRHVAGALHDHRHQPRSGLPAFLLGQLRRDLLDNATFYGSVGLFMVLFFLFIRFLPMISMYEVRELLPFSKPGGGTVK